MVVGGGIARLMPTGLTQSVRAQHALSVVVGGAFSVLAVSAGFMLASAHGYPGSLRGDADVGRIFSFPVSSAPDWEDSAQVKDDDACRRAATTNRPATERQRACELAVRTSPHFAPSYETLARAEAELGNERYANALRRVGQRIGTIPRP